MFTKSEDFKSLLASETESQHKGSATPSEIIADAEKVKPR